MLGDLDQPLADQALVPMYALSRQASRSVKVIVGGEGADEYFAGYPRYRWLEPAQRLTRVGGGRGLALAARAWPGTAHDRLASLASAGSVAEKNLAWVSAGRADHRSELYGDRLRGLAHAPGVAAAQAHFAEDGDAASQAMRCDQRLWLPGDVLTKADRAGMLNSLEIRTPFLERTLMEFASSVSFEVHSERGGKALLKSVYEQRVPGSTPPRKRGFGVPAAQWLRGPLRDYVRHCADGARVVTDGWIRRDTLAALARITCRETPIARTCSGR